MELIDFVKEHYEKKFHELKTFDLYWEKYNSLPQFGANENIHEVLEKSGIDKGLYIDSESEFIESSDTIDIHIHWIMRMCTQYYLTKAFEAMKIDVNDPNIIEQSLGKGTPGRIAKMWCGADGEDVTELGSGRWNKEPALSVFPNNVGNFPITKEVEITSCCSHHFIPFTTKNFGKAIITYIPKDKILGISKLQRFVNWASKRFWLQEDLTNYIGRTISRIAETPDVCVEIIDAKHGCETYRGVNNSQGSLSTTYTSGIFSK